MKLKLTRPKNLDEFIGKDEIKENIRVYLQSAKIQGRHLDHCLFYGQPGCGKTSLAYIIANELSCRLRCVQGTNIQTPKDVYNLALSLQSNEIIFLDEIHAINKLCFEAFYLLLEDFCLDINIGKDFNTKITRIKVPHFTMIAATTLLSKIPKPMEERFGILINFSPYSFSEMKKLVKNASKKIDIKLSNDDLDLIARNCKGIPRNAINILSRVDDFYTVQNDIVIAKILAKLGIYDNGLTRDDLRYLCCFSCQNPSLGLRAISQMTDFDCDYIESRIEPYLLQQKYVIRTEKGRKITQLGQKIVSKIK